MRVECVIGEGVEGVVCDRGWCCVLMCRVCDW